MPGKLVEQLKKLGQKAHWPESPKIADGRPAAVLAPLVLPHWDSNLEQAKLLYIKRAGHLKKHAGQIAFPGGVAEDHDPDLLSTGFREGHEEVGLLREHSELLAELPSAFTPTGFTLKPFFVATVQRDFIPEPSEVESLHLIPITDLLTCPVRYEERTWQGNTYRVVYFDTQTVCVWGVTGRITELLLSRFFDWKAP